MPIWTELKLAIDAGYFAEADHRISLDSSGEWCHEVREKFSLPEEAGNRSSGYLSRQDLKQVKDLVAVLLEGPKGDKVPQLATDGPTYELLLYYPDDTVKGWCFYWALGYEDWDAAFESLCGTIMKIITKEEIDGSL
jgi:hypothetical protein